MSSTKRRPGNISFARLKLGLSQLQLADSLGVSRSMIAMVETGKRKFPSQVAELYLQLCRKAELQCPDSYVVIKRGRKPRNNFSFVTNFEKSAADTSRGRVVENLLKKRSMLNFQYTSLQFRKKAVEEKQSRLSGQLLSVDALLSISTKLLHILPEGKQRDRHEYRAAVYYARKVRLKQQLRKCSPVVLLQIEYAMNKSANQVGMIDQFITKLDREQRSTVREMLNTYGNTDSSHPAMKFTNDSQCSMPGWRLEINR